MDFCESHIFYIFDEPLVLVGETDHLFREKDPDHYWPNLGRGKNLASIWFRGTGLVTGGTALATGGIWENSWTSEKQCA